MFDSFSLNQLLKDFGRNVTLRKLSEGPYNPTTGTVTRTPTDYIVRAYFYNDVPQQTEFSSITFGSKRVVMSSTLANGDPTPQPEVQDQILSIGDTTVVTKVSPIYSQSRVICFLLHTDE